MTTRTDLSSVPHGVHLRIRTRVWERMVSYVANSTDTTFGLWQKAFKEAGSVSYQLKYMFRERVGLAENQFKKSPSLQQNQNDKEKALFTELVEGAFKVYGHGILPPKELKDNASNLTKKGALQKVAQTHTASIHPSIFN